MGISPPKLDNQSDEWLPRHWFTTGVDHESGGIRPLLDSRAGQLRPEHRGPAPCRRTRGGCTEDFARLIRLSEEQGWRLIVTEMGI
jgi:hypothetical protein